MIQIKPIHNNLHITTLQKKIDKKLINYLTFVKLTLFNKSAEVEPAKKNFRFISFFRALLTTPLI